MGKTSKWSFSGTFEYDAYEVEFYASGTHCYDPGCMYLRNGDPGYQSEEDFNVDEVEIEGIYDVSIESVNAGTSDVDVYDTLSEDIIEDMKDCITEAIEDGKYEVDYEGDCYD